MKNDLICSAPDAGTLLKMIAQYFYGKPEDFTIHEKVLSNGTTEGTIYKKVTGKKLSNYVTRSTKKGRYRFEYVW
jgi:hypothetical protein